MRIGRDAKEVVEKEGKERGESSGGGEEVGSTEGRRWAVLRGGGGQY